MSVKRELSAIQEDYQRLCLKAGHLQYQIDVLSRDLELVNQTLRELNFEAAALPPAEAPASETTSEESPAVAQG